MTAESKMSADEESSLEIDINNNKNFEIEVAKKKYKALILQQPLHDPENQFTRN